MNYYRDVATVIFFRAVAATESIPADSEYPRRGHVYLRNGGDIFLSGAAWDNFASQYGEWLDTYTTERKGKK